MSRFFVEYLKASELMNADAQAEVQFGLEEYMALDRLEVPLRGALIVGHQSD